MSDRGGGLAGSPYQQLDLDIQNLIKAVNGIATLMTKPAAQSVTGSKTSGAALVSLLKALAAAGIIIDNTVA